MHCDGGKSLRYSYEESRLAARRRRDPNPPCCSGVPLIGRPSSCRGGTSHGLAGLEGENGEARRPHIYPTTSSFPRRLCPGPYHILGIARYVTPIPHFVVAVGIGMTVILRGHGMERSRGPFPDSMPLMEVKRQKGWWLDGQTCLLENIRMPRSAAGPGLVTGSQGRAYRGVGPGLQRRRDAGGWSPFVTQRPGHKQWRAAAA